MLRNLLRNSSRLQNYARKSYGSISHNAGLSVDLDERLDRKTSIICTVGPASWHREGIKDLLLRGMNVLRLNFSHGSHEDKERVIRDLRSIIAEFRTNRGSGNKNTWGSIDFSDGSREDVCAIAADTKGPEIRTGHFSGDVETVDIVGGQELLLTSNVSMRDKGDSSIIYTTYTTLAEELTVGQQIFVDDGLLSLEVLSTSPSDGTVLCKAKNSAKLGQQKGINIPYPFISKLPAVTEQDAKDLAFAVEVGVDYIFASFIRKAADVDEVRNALGEKGKDVKVISKIENQEGCDNFDEILAASDGIMVARGDLGIEIPPEQVTTAQKLMIARCNLVGKPVICATQMLESMVNNPRPTRAECSDVANAVLDGADAVMLSGETAKGNYPNEALEMMSQICREAEVAIDYRGLFLDLRRSIDKMQKDEKSSFDRRLDALATSCVIASEELNAKAIIVLTKSGDTAMAVAKYRPKCPILAVVSSEVIANRVLLSRGIIPLLLSDEEIESQELAMECALEALQDMGLYDSNTAVPGEGQKLVAVTGSGGGFCSDEIRQLILM
jgi:pyruvate kinase